MYAVTVEPLNTIFFISDPPDPCPWPVESGVGLDYAPNVARWTRHGQMPEQVLCVSTANSKYYKIFKYRKEVQTHEFWPTGRAYGGIFAKESWDRFAAKLAESLAAEDAVEEESDVELVRDLRRGVKGI